MARSREGFVCHAHDTMVSYELHHVWPLGYHGPNIKANLVKICPNAHSDIHYLMELILKDKPWKKQEYGPQVRAIAELGAAQVLAYGDKLAAQIEASK